MKPHETRSVEELCESIAAGEKAEFVLFYGHKPLPDGSIGKPCFSQWWPCHFEVNGDVYKTAEHFMMAEKARVFDDEEMRQEILKAEKPGQAKKFGRQVRGFDSEAWNQARSEIVVTGNVAKFGQNSEMREFLLGTGDAVLVEASPRDRIWGIGMGANHENAQHPKNWRGQNLLGFALMEARIQLRANVE